MIAVRINRTILALFHRDFEASVDNTFSEIRSTLNRVKSKAEPTLKTGLEDSYKSIKEFAKHVEENPGCLSYTGDDGIERKLKSKLIQSSSKTFHYLIYDDELINQFKETEMHLDGTFFSRTKINRVNQFFSIMATKFNEVSTKVIYQMD